MKQIYSDVIQYKGSHYDFGFMQGEQLKDSLIIKNRNKQWKVHRPRFSISETEVKHALSFFAPQIWEELLGLQDGLKWPLHNVLQHFSGYQLEYVRSGCSIYTRPDYMIRNYDYHPKTYEGRFVLFQPTDHGFASIGPSQLITGRMDGMNEHGLVLGYNFIHRKKPGDGFICNMIARIILEGCKNVEEAILLLKEIPHRHSFSYVLLDNNRKTYIVEATPRDVHVRKSNICTNHFEILKHENRHHLDDSYARMVAILAGEKKITDVYQSFRLLNDVDKGVFSKQYKNWAGTIHTSAYFPEQRMVWFVLGGDRKPVAFDFKAWLKGEKLTIKRVLGKLDTDATFLHIDEDAR